jgi:hypothetical protein
MTLLRNSPGPRYCLPRIPGLSRGWIGWRGLLGICFNVLDAVGKAGAGFRSLADSWADTTPRMAA